MAPVIRRRRKLVAGAALLLCAGALTRPASAEDFFFNLFGGFGARPPGPSRIVLPFTNDGAPTEAPRPRVTRRAGEVAWCVRTCDGRYFPITGQDAQGRAASCDRFCPASKTELVYGNDIDHAATANGKA